MAEAALHIDKKIGHIRELRGMEARGLAAELCISQQAIFKIEQNADVDDEQLQKNRKSFRRICRCY